jgi:uncharacterized protein YdiU (UPF0061 family)
VQANDSALIGQLLSLLQQFAVDYTIFFRRLCDFSTQATNASIRDLFIDRESFDQWAAQYRSRLQQENSDDALRCIQMKNINQKYILRNYLAQQAIDFAKQNDFSMVQNLLQVLLAPFDEHPAFESFAAFPPEWGKHLEISCSS